MLYILYGEDDFSSREALQRIKKEIGAGDLAEGNTTVVDGKSASADQISSCCMAMPFFTSQRLVIVEGLLQRFSVRRSRPAEAAARDTAQDDFAAALEQCVRTMPPSTVLVLVDGEIRNANPLLKRLSPLGKVEAFHAPKGESLVAWIEDRVTGKQGRISPPAARLMAGNAGDNLWALDNEIDKLLLYASGPAITEEDVKTAMAHSREANQFAMVDALMARHPDVALRLLHQLLDEGMKAPQLVSFFLRELGLVLKAREAVDLRSSPQEAQARTGLAPGFRLEKVLRQARSTSIEEIRRLYSLLLEADLAFKTGAASEELALDIFVAEACGR